jgi:imidazolonepropionase-like amidohydrolase
LEALVNTEQPTLVIKAGRLIDGTGAEPRRDVVVTVRNDRISRVEPAAEYAQHPEPSPDAVVIDAAGQSLMPGLIDAHCHMTYGESLAQEEQDLYTSVESRTLRAAWNARAVLEAGVTSISQPGGSHYIGVALRDAIAGGYVQGPRMYTAGRYLTTSNGLTDFYPDSVGNPQGGIGILTNTLAEMISEVRHQVKNGVDLIKLADSPMGDYQAFTDEEIATLTRLTHQLGRRITIHARGDAEVRASVRAGVDWIMHGNIMSDQTVDELAASGIPLVPTLLLLANWVEYGEFAGVPDGLVGAGARMLEYTAESLSKARQAGVTFVMGTDTGFAITPYGEWHARELELLMKYAGISALEAISAGTRNAAVTVGLEGQLGEIAPGMIADMLVVDGDPAKDIRILQNRDSLLSIIKAGRVQVFTDRPVRSWPNDQSRVLSRRILRRADVE